MKIKKIREAAMIMVTGGMGFIGLHTTRALLDLGEQVVVTRFRTTRLPSFLADRVGDGLTVVPLDLADSEAVTATMREHGVASVVHLAVPPRANLTAIEELTGSTRATLGLMEAAIRGGVKRVTTASSLAVYLGLFDQGPLHEDRQFPLSAVHPIEANKKIDEIIGAFLTTTGALQVVRARIGNIWGPCYHSMMNAPSRIAMLALGRAERFEGRPDPMEAHPDDMLDMLYVRDCGRALALLHVAPDLQQDAYNVSGGRMTRYGDLVEAFKRAVPEADLTLRPPERAPAGRVDSFMQIGALRKDTGFEPRFGLQEAVADYIDWLRSNPE